MHTVLREPLPCNPAAETALRPPSWCSESFSSQRPSLGIHYRGVQWEAGAVDGGSII